MKQNVLSHTELVRQLKNAGENAGLTQSELARHLQTDQSIVAKIERGIRRLDVLEFVEICSVLDVPFETIFFAARNVPAKKPTFFEYEKPSGWVRKYANFA